MANGGSEQTAGATGAVAGMRRATAAAEARMAQEEYGRENMK